MVVVVLGGGGEHPHGHVNHDETDGGDDSPRDPVHQEGGDVCPHLGRFFPQLALIMFLFPPFFLHSHLEPKSNSIRERFKKYNI